MHAIAGDGLGDTFLPYNSNGKIQNGGDFLPLVLPSETVCIDPDGDNFGDLGTDLSACAGSATQADNCPALFNPDQLDIDGDTTGDVCDICPLDATNTCDVTESASANINAMGGTVVTSSGNAKVIIPASALTSDTSISIGGSDETPDTNISSFQIQIGAEAASLIYTFSQEGINFSVPATITLKYNDAGIDESTIDIYFFNTTTLVWEGQSAVCDTVLNECILTVDHFSDYIVGASGGMPETEISSCTVINSPGIYNLTTDIINSSDWVCIQIASSNVVFDGQGHTIDGLGYSGSGVSVNNIINVTVKNLVLSEWWDGIYFENVTYGSIENNEISDTGWGIRLNKLSNNNNITNNRISSSFNSGIYIHDASNIILHDNDASENEWGISLRNEAEDSINNIITNNNVSSNTYGGMFLIRVYDSIITDNIITSNPTDGILFQEGGNNDIYNNYFKNANNNLRFISTVESNSLNTSKQSGVNIVGGPYIGGNYWAKLDGTGFSETCNDVLPSDGICDSSYTVDTGNTDYLPLKMEGEIGDCTTIASPGVYRLTADIINSSAFHCIIINASDVVFDGQGHTIDGLDTDYLYGVYVHHPSLSLTNVTVKNLRVTDWYYGVYYSATQHSSIENINALSNEYGIYMYDSEEVSISNNDISSNQYGIYNRLRTYEDENGTVYFNPNAGNIISNNTVNLNYFGISLEHCNNNTITRNTVSLNDYGISLLDSIDNNIYNNLFNNTNSVYFLDYIYGNNWDIPKHLETNIIGGPFFGGNYWAELGGTGFSETCEDFIPYDGICDSGYEVVFGVFDNNIDYLPLTTVNITLDSDNDGILDYLDNCRFVPNPDQNNSDSDFFGDACDNCPTANNSGQEDSDEDGIGDACDNCPTLNNSGQENSDTDSWGDACDNCWYVANSNQLLDGDVNCPAMPYTTDPQCGDACGVLSCGNTLISDYTMNDNLTDCSGTAITIGADDITLDCNDNWIDGTGTYGSIGIWIEDKQGVTIKNCNLQELYFGILLFNSSGNDILENNLHDGYSGISLTESGYNNIWNNTFTYNKWENSRERINSNNNNWNLSYVGNTWDDFGENPGYPDYYEIKGDGDGIDWHPTGICYDGDSDGYNSPGGDCGPVDCDTHNASIYPGAVEVCNGADDNCDGTVDEGFPDTDNDGLADCVDNCPDVSNILQSDYDNDGQGNACDNCPDDYNPDQNDTDNSGIGDECNDANNDPDSDEYENAYDNCFLAYNPLQEDTDGDRIGDACDICVLDPENDVDGDSICGDVDNCPDVSNSLQYNNDNDGPGNACDNCWTVANSNQNDFDNDGDGDACDCDDVFQSPSEDEVDCGGPCSACVDCTWCGTKITPIRVKDQHNSGQIDVVFVPDVSYSGNLAQFGLDVVNHIRNGYFMIDQWAVDPIPADYKDRFNFYLYNSGFGNNETCSGTLPTDFWTDASFTDSAGILAQSGAWGCASGLGPPSNWIALTSRRDIVIHESGHSIFGLVDEYCGNTYYTQNDPDTNVWSSNASCQADIATAGFTLGNCRQIKSGTCSKNFWRYDPDAPNKDIMTCACFGTPSFYEADTRRVNYMFDNWPAGSTKGILVIFNINNNIITELSTEVVDNHPDLGVQYESFSAEAFSSTEELLAHFGIWDPRMELGEEMVYTDNVNFTIIFPFYDNLKTFEIKNVTTSETLVTVDLTETLQNYCNDNNYQDQECQALDLDNDGILDVDDNCPFVVNDDQLDTDGDGIGDACDPDVDGDGVPNENDKCLGTISWTAEQELKPNHYENPDISDLTGTYGCSCEQILDCKPGNNNGEYKFGCSQGTYDIWVTQDPDSWALECQVDGVVAMEGVSKALFENTDQEGAWDIIDGDNDGDGVADSDDDMIEDSDPPGDPDYGIPDWHPKSKHKK